MFGWIRKAKAVKLGTEACLSLVRLKEMDEGIPPGFWRDPYVLGYFGGMIGTLAAFDSNHKLAGEDLRRVIALTLARLTGARGGEVIRNYQMSVKELSDDFQQGMYNASKVAMIICGSNDFDDDADVVVAKHASKSQVSAAAIVGLSLSEKGHIASYLTQQYFLKEVKQRWAHRT